MSYSHDGFVTTGKRPFNVDAFPMRLFQKAKRYGVWDPYDLDFSTDRETWNSSTDEEREAVLGTISVFQAGEESVTLDILPLIMAVAQEGRIEEEIFLTSFLFEEAKHTEFFQRFLREVAGVTDKSLEQYHTPSYRKIFYEELPSAMWALRDDPSPTNQIRASVTYNMIVEGVLAETGYFGFNYQLEQTGENPLPGLLEGIAKLRQDESRHIAYGIYLISRLVSAHPELWTEAESRMNGLLPLAMQFVQERMGDQIDKYGRLPYDMDPAVVMEYASSQYQKRLTRLQRARRQSLDEVEKEAIDADDEG